MENKIFSDFITFAIDFVGGATFVLKFISQVPEAQKKI